MSLQLCSNFLGFVQVITLLTRTCQLGCPCNQFAISPSIFLFSLKRIVVVAFPLQVMISSLPWYPLSMASSILQLYTGECEELNLVCVLSSCLGVYGKVLPMYFGCVILQPCTTQCSKEGTYFTMLSDVWLSFLVCF